MRDALKTLFYPFEAETLPMPGKDQRVLFIGAEPGFRLPQGFDATLSLVQGFRPYIMALEGARHTVLPRAEGDGYDVVLVLAGRHRGFNERNVAEAIARAAPDGLIVVAGGKEDGIASLRKRLDGLVPLEGHLPKHHGIVLWFRRSGSADAAGGALRAENPDALVDGRFRAAPGMFSFDRVDAGSRLLADSLPGDIKGAVADFCAGWGYLAAETAARARSLSTLDLYEADFQALEAAKENLQGAGIEPGFFWRDLLKEPAEKRYDVIVMNPPFHLDRAADPEIGQGMIKAAAKALKQGGRLFMVANRGLPYQALLAANFAVHQEIAADGAFKVYLARR